MISSPSCAILTSSLRADVRILLYELPAGTVIKLREQYSRAGLTSNQFKEAKRNKLVEAFLNDHEQSKVSGGIFTARKESFNCLEKHNPVSAANHIHII